MYNRYIPQPDGSYRRNQVQEPQKYEPPRKPQPTPPTYAAPSPPPPSPKRPPERHHSDRKGLPCRDGDGILGFFKNLLPKDLDTEDLLIIILLLLMAGDREKDRNTALLTIALYFFM